VQAPITPPPRITTRMVSPLMSRSGADPNAHRVNGNRFVSF
jgi:hypothetical protein